MLFLRQIALYLIFLLPLHSAYLEVLQWEKGETFSGFLEKHNFPLSLYYNLDKEDQRVTEEIYSGITYYILRSSENNNSIEQILVPVSEELQLHIYWERGQYHLEAIPIEFQERDHRMVLELKESSLYNNIRNVTNSSSVASLFVKSFKNRIDFRSQLYRDSKIAMLYSRYYRLGEPFGSIKLKVAMLHSGRHKKYVFSYDSKFYDYKGRYVERTYFRVPVNKPRVTSKFTKKRWHPILKRYRAHLGVDYGARTGTPIYSAGNGVVSYKGVSRGYGNLLKINHKEGYQTLYAHMHRFRKGLRKGQKVHKGQVIGYVGSTGLSTGPHLHFGMYRNGTAIDPQKVVKIESHKSIPKSERAKFFEMRDEYYSELQESIKSFNRGLNITDRYSSVDLKCEVALTATKNIDDSDNSLTTSEVEGFNFEEEENSDIEFNEYTPPTTGDYNEEYLELSEEYLEY